MKQSTKRLVSSVGALIFIVLAFVVLLNFIQPAYQELSVRRGEVASRERFLAEQEGVVRKVESLITTYESGSSVREVVSLALPPEPEIAQVVAQLNGLIVANSLIAQGFGITPELVDRSARRAERREKRGGLNAGEIGTVMVRLSVVGTYGDFKRFLKNLETNIRIMDITQLAIRSAGKPNQDLYVFDMTVAAYYQKLPSPS
jgi:Tfp pilus assembly protein PilO